MYPFNTAAMDIDASILVYLVGGLSCFPFFFLFFLLVLELAQIYLDKQYRGRLPAEKVERSRFLVSVCLFVFLIICLSRIHAAINSRW